VKAILFFQFHVLAAATYRTLATFGNDELRIALLANVSLPYFISHGK